jgi:hypothetical protein
MDEIYSESTEYAQHINTRLTKNEILFLKKISPEAIKAALLIIFTNTLQIILHSNPFHNFQAGSDTKEKERVRLLCEKILKTNENTIITKKLASHNIIEEISKNNTVIISITSKLCANIINRLNKKISEEHNLKEINKNHHPSTRTLFESFLTDVHPFESFLPYIYEKEAYQIVAAHIILFGIKNFQLEITKTLESFSESACLKSLLIAKSLKPTFFNNINKIKIITNNEKKPSFESEMNIRYQIALIEGLYELNYLIDEKNEKIFQNFKTKVTISVDLLKFAVALLAIMSIKQISINVDIGRDMEETLAITKKDFESQKLKLQDIKQKIIAIQKQQMYDQITDQVNQKRNSIIFQKGIELSIPDPDIITPFESAHNRHEQYFTQEQKNQIKEEMEKAIGTEIKLSKDISDYIIEKNNKLPNKWHATIPLARPESIS